MLIGFLLWGGMYTIFALVFPRLSTPDHQLPGYFLFEVSCLAPWLAWLFWIAIRKGGATGLSVLVQACAILAITYPIHVITTHKLFWTYFQDKDVLLGVRIGGVPIEEYFFYPLTINLSILMYLLMCDYLKARRLPDLAINRKTLRLVFFSLSAVCFGLGFYVLTLRDPGQIAPATLTWDATGVPHYAEGPRNYSWTLVCLFSAGFNLLLLYLAELYTSVMIRAVIPIIGVYVLLCLLIDLMGVSRGWWVFNDQQASGYWIGGVPLEDLPMYVTGVMMPIALFESCRRLLGGRGLP